MTTVFNFHTYCPRLPWSVQVCVFSFLVLRFVGLFSRWGHKNLLLQSACALQHPDTRSSGCAVSHDVSDGTCFLVFEHCMQSPLQSIHWCVLAHQLPRLLTRRAQSSTLNSMASNRWELQHTHVCSRAFGLPCPGCCSIYTENVIPGLHDTIVSIDCFLLSNQLCISLERSCLISHFKGPHVTALPMFGTVLLLRRPVTPCEH